MIKSESIAKISSAFCLFQSKQKTIKFNTYNKFFGSKYADLTALIEGSKQNLSDCKLSVSQLLTNEGLTTLLIHESGEFFGDTFQVEVVNQKGINSAQAMGISITYARRYAYASILGIVTDQDVDGGDPKSETQKKNSSTPKKQPEHESQSDQGSSVKLKQQRNFNLITSLFNDEVINESQKTLFENKTKTASSDVVLDAVYDALKKKSANDAQSQSFTDHNNFEKNQ